MILQNVPKAICALTLSKRNRIKLHPRSSVILLVSNLQNLRARSQVKPFVPLLLAIFSVKNLQMEIGLVGMAYSASAGLKKRITVLDKSATQTSNNSP